MDKSSPIGVFDSGMGGLSVVREIRRQLPDEDVLFFGDSLHNPYGTKSPEQIAAYSMDICRNFEMQDVKAIVIACNTATSACAPLLRKSFDLDIVGMEPALKVAAEKGGHQRIAVWATRLTLQEQKFEKLLHRFDQDHDIRKIPCMDLVSLVEADQLSDTEKVDEVLKGYLEESDWQNLDSIVLGCTHFIFFKERLKELTGHQVEIIDGNAGTVRHLKELLEAKNLLNDAGGLLRIENSLPEKEALSKQLWKVLEETNEPKECMAEL